MTDEQKQQIIALRRMGQDMAGDAAQLQLSINTVKSFCRRHSLVAKSEASVCEQCGKPIEQNPGRKRKRFCCDDCRNKWWNAHLELVKRKGSLHIYLSGLPKGRNSWSTATAIGKFCSHACYIAYRFRRCPPWIRGRFRMKTTFQVVMIWQGGCWPKKHHREGVPGLRAGDDLSLSAFFRGLIHDNCIKQSDI